jgi:ankyrin repeat protein
VRLLLEKDTELESKDKYSRTPLSRAAGYGHEAVVRLLFEQGAELESKDNDGGTPLSWAAVNGHEAVVKLLKLKTQ